MLQQSPKEYRDQIAYRYAVEDLMYENYLDQEEAKEAARKEQAIQAALAKLQQPQQVVVKGEVKFKR